MKTARPERPLAEADLYGYSKWLASHLGFDFAPRSLRGFQHGWIWWDAEDADYAPGFGLDPNLDAYWGVLVQSEKIARELNQKGIFAKACGLPFLNYYKHCGLKGSFKGLRDGSVLYVPAHSNPWHDISFNITAASRKFVRAYPDCAIMLGWNDRHLADAMSTSFRRVEIGAGALESESFLRLMSIFERYDYLITDSIGSHICYALACGMKVGIHSGLHAFSHARQQGSGSMPPAKSDQASSVERRRFVYTPEYLDQRFPGIVIDGGLPSYSRLPSDLAEARPDVIAGLLGWDLTYESERVKDPVRAASQAVSAEQPGRANSPAVHLALCA